jgi:RimJ/RimL family protein N-acetyltransferase
MLREGSVVLTALDPGHADIVRAWITDPEVNAWLATGHLPITHASELAFYAAADEESASGKGHHFEIHSADDMRLLGMCGVIEIDPIDRHGELGIFIGDPAGQGKGHGRDTINALLRFAFHTLGLNTIRLRAIEGNERALALYRKLGFRDVGTLREGRYVRGRFHDVALLDMTRGDYDARGR